MAKKTAIQR